MRQYISIFLTCILLLGCKGKQAQEESKQEQPSFSIPANTEALLGASLSDLTRQYGEKHVYYSNNYGFFCWVDEEDLSVFFHVPKMPYETLDIESLPMVYDPEEGYDYYDFSAGEYAPDDFLVYSVIIRKSSLPKMFGGKDPVTLDLINEIFDKPGRMQVEYDQGMITGNSAGPFILEGKDNAIIYVSFSLDLKGNAAAASVWLK